MTYGILIELTEEQVKEVVRNLKAGKSFKLDGGRVTLGSINKVGYEMESITFKVKKEKK